ncbi:MAG: pyridoxamine 5'-phosphate oxidase [Bryobacteraceae bacterium]
MDQFEIQNNIRDPRVDYSAPPLDEDALDADPIRQFLHWYGEASAAGVAEPNAMTLCTVDAEGSPDARMVLLRGCGADGFHFYSSDRSAKGLQIAAGSGAALVFYWAQQHRQVRVRGPVVRLSRELAAEYWATRPRGSQAAAWASRQSAPVASREELERDCEAVEQRFSGVDIPPPDDWAGYTVQPDAVEFWQGREFRLHDRVRYRRKGDSGWLRERLAP